MLTTVGWFGKRLTAAYKKDIETDCMNPETRLILIKLAEDFADGIRTGRISFTEAQGRRIIAAVSEALNPQPKMRI